MGDHIMTRSLYIGGRDKAAEVAKRREQFEKEMERKREAKLREQEEKLARIAQQKEKELREKAKQKAEKELRRQKEVLDRRMKKLEDEKAKKGELLLKTHNIVSRTAGVKKPVYAFGSRTPRELSYLEKLNKDQKEYSTKLLPIDGKTPTRQTTYSRSSPAKTSPESSMTRSMYMAATTTTMTHKPTPKKDYSFGSTLKSSSAPRARLENKPKSNTPNLNKLSTSMTQSLYVTSSAKSSPNVTKTPINNNRSFNKTPVRVSTPPKTQEAKNPTPKPKTIQPGANLVKKASSDALPKVQPKEEEHKKEESVEKDVAPAQLTREDEKVENVVEDVKAFEPSLVVEESKEPLIYEQESKTVKSPTPPPSHEDFIAKEIIENVDTFNQLASLVDFVGIENTPSVHPIEHAPLTEEPTNNVHAPSETISVHENFTPVQENLELIFHDNMKEKFEEHQEAPVMEHVEVPTSDLLLLSPASEHVSSSHEKLTEEPMHMDKPVNPVGLESPADVSEEKSELLVHSEVTPPVELEKKEELQETITEKLNGKIENVVHEEVPKLVEALEKKEEVKEPIIEASQDGNQNNSVNKNVDSDFADSPILQRSQNRSQSPESSSSAKESDGETGKTHAINEQLKVKAVARQQERENRRNKLSQILQRTRGAQPVPETPRGQYGEHGSLLTNTIEDKKSKALEIIARRRQGATENTSDSQQEPTNASKPRSLADELSAFNLPGQPIFEVEEKTIVTKSLNKDDKNFPPDDPTPTEDLIFEDHPPEPKIY